MRKTILLVALAATLATQAQIEVKTSGQVVVGTAGPSTVVPDRYASLAVFAQDGPHEGYISFGDGVNVTIGEGGYGDTNKMFMRGYGGIIYGSSTSNGLASRVVFDFTPASGKFSFYCPVSSSSFLTTSDARLKTDVESLEGSWQNLAGLTPVSYRINLPVKTLPGGEEEAVKDSKANADALTEDMGVSYGFIAQEVQKIYPDLVREDEEGMLAIDYNGFIPLLVDAVKSMSDEVGRLSARVEEQEAEIALLSGHQDPSRKPASVDGVASEKIALMQNRPNPFNVATTIECTLPGSVADASLYIYDLQGKQIRSITLTERGRVSTVIDGSSLQPGMYIYALIADGTEIDSKRMILTD